MNDPDVIELYFSRSEEAIAETKRSFGALMRSIAGRILSDRRDAEEAVQDALLSAWNSIPPNRPLSLAAYVSRLTRNAAIDRAKRLTRKKRGGGEYDAVLDEAIQLAGFTSFEDDVAERVAFHEILDRFLDGLTNNRRVVFVQRYWHMLPIKDIARERGMTEGAVKTELSRTRRELRELLIKEGFYYE